MRNKNTSNLFVGLDIGTTKVVALVGEAMTNGRINVIGIGTHPSRGLKRGIVINIDTTVQSIQAAIKDAQLMAGCEIKSVYTGIAGSHIRSFNSHGVVAIRDREITQLDVERVIDAAKAVAIPADQKILHILPQEFIVDGQDGIREPVGMSGVRLEARVHIVTGGVSAAQNIVKCIERCDLHTNDVILQPLASSAAVLTDDEKELGVCLIDIGGGTTDIAIFTDGAIKHSAVIPIAGDQVTNDVAIALRTPTKYAEEIKVKYSCALTEMVDADATIEVPGASHRQTKQISQTILSNVVEARYEELFTLALAELRRSGFSDAITSGIVLTGGASKTRGLAELAEQIFQMPIRLGAPQNVGGMTEIANNPVYATAVGLLLIGYQHNGQPKSIKNELVEPKKLWERMKSWFQGNF